MPLLNELRSADFSPLIDQLFRVYYGVEQPITLKLVEVSDLRHMSPDASVRVPFSLIFLGTEALGGSVNSYLQQGTYRFEHDSLNPLDIFIVPLGPDRDSAMMRYQAIFN